MCEVIVCFNSGEISPCLSVPQCHHILHSILQHHWPLCQFLQELMQVQSAVVSSRASRTSGKGAMLLLDLSSRPDMYFLLDTAVTAYRKACGKDIHTKFFLKVNQLLTISLNLNNHQWLNGLDAQMLAWSLAVSSADSVTDNQRWKTLVKKIQ